LLASNSAANEWCATTGAAAANIKANEARKKSGLFMRAFYCFLGPLSATLHRSEHTSLVRPTFDTSDTAYVESNEE